jgi:hypothetical protein
MPKARTYAARNQAFQAAVDIARNMPLEEGLLGHQLKRVTASELAGPCPQCGGDDRFAINKRKRRWLCRGCNAKGGDAIGLAMHVDGCDFIAAVELLTGVRRDPTSPRDPSARPRPNPAAWVDHARKAEEVEEEARTQDHRRAVAARIVSEMRPIAGSPAETYLRDIRGIDTRAIHDVLERIDAIGWHPSVWFGQPDPKKPLHEFHGHHFGCIIGVMTDSVTALPTGAISRTYLTAEGSKLCRAKTLGTPAGIIRLTPDEDVAEGLHLAEGLETALDAMAIGLRPMWSTGTTSLLKAFPVLPGIEALTIFADHDAKGQGDRAAEELLIRYRRSSKVEVRIFRSEAIGDLNDATRRLKAAS